MNSSLLQDLPEVREISKRTSERTALLNKEQVFSVGYVAKNASEICWLKSEDGTMKMISPLYTRHLGVSKRDYLGRTDSDIFGADGEVFEEHDRILRENHPLCVFVWEEWRRKDGARERGLVLKKSQVLDGEITTFGMIIRDTIEVISDARNKVDGKRAANH